MCQLRARSFPQSSVRTGSAAFSSPSLCDLHASGMCSCDHRRADPTHQLSHPQREARRRADLIRRLDATRAVHAAAVLLPERAFAIQVHLQAHGEHQLTFRCPCGRLPAPRFVGVLRRSNAWCARRASPVGGKLTLCVRKKGVATRSWRPTNTSLLTASTVSKSQHAS